MKNNKFRNRLDSRKGGNSMRLEDMREQFPKNAGEHEADD